MSEIKCPKCQSVFKVDESGMADIIKQVKTSEFDKELEERISSSVEFAVLKKEKDLETKMAEREIAFEKRLTELQGNLRDKDVALAAEMARKEQVITEYSAQMATANAQKKLELKETVEHVEKERDRLKAALESTKTETELAVTKAVAEIATERDSLLHKLEAKDSERQISENSLISKYEQQLKSKDELIDYYKDFKAKLSTKEIGESLEKYCSDEFNKLRATAFQNVYFEKDTKNESKGDYIYREADTDGTEIVSIMFEMKNKEEDTAGKKNGDFLDKLDRDRTKKDCEYAILVSLLELGSPLYDSGIVDLSYKYPKMYVIRPQFFIPMITVLRNAAMKSLENKKALAEYRNQHLDIASFEETVIDVRDKIANDYRLAGENFGEAIKQIDKSIEALNRTRAHLLKSEDKFRLANKKGEEFLNIPKLTDKNATMKEKFDELKNKDK